MIRRCHSLAAALLGLILACSPERAKQPDGSSLSGTVPPDVGLYVTNETSGDLSVIDLKTFQVVSTIPLGKRPRGIALAPDGTKLYVALSGSPSAPPGVDETQLPPPDRSADGIGIIDIARLRLDRVLPSGTDPEVVAVSPDGSRLFVANEDAATASVVDIGSGRIIDAFGVGGEPEGVSVQPGSGRVWVASEEDNSVAIIDPELKKVIASVPVGPRPRSIAFSPDGSVAYVPSETGGLVSIIDATDLAVTGTIPLDGLRAMGTAVSADGSRLYVTTGRSRKLVAIDTHARKVIGSVDAGVRPWGLALTPDGRTAFTVNGPSNDLSVIDLDTMKVVRTISVGSGPWGVAYVPLRATYSRDDS